MKVSVKDILLLTGILLFTFFIYFNTLKSDFINYDDDTHITKNDDIKSLNSDHIKKIFSTNYVGMYQPFTTLSFAIEYKFFKFNPLYYHLHNVLLHLLNSLLVFWLIFNLTKRKEAAYFCMLLFAVHPMHVESVAWITERKDVLYAFFYLLSMIFYLKFIDKTKYIFFFFSLLFFVFSCLSKSAAITLPVVLILLELYGNKQKERKLIFAKIPFFIIAILFGVITLLSQGAFESKTGLVDSYSLIERIIFAAYSFFYYLSSFIVPINLSAIHPFPIKTGNTIAVTYYLIAFCSVLIVIFSWILLKRTKDQQFEKNLLLDFLMFFVPLLLILQVPVGSALVAERYTYLPYIGLSLIIFRLYDKFREKIKPLIKQGIQLVGFLFLLLLAIISFHRVKVWKNSFVLNDDIIRKYPENAAIAYNNRGLARIGSGDLKGAMDDINKSIQQSRNFADAYQNRGFVKYKMNDPYGAITDYDFAINLYPQKANWYVNRAISKELIQNYNGAIADYTQAIVINQKYEKAYLYRADDWFLLEYYPNAIIDLNMVIQINPQNIEAYSKRCYSLIKINKINEACRDCSFAAGFGDQAASEMLQKHCK